MFVLCLPIENGLPIINKTIQNIVFQLIVNQQNLNITTYSESSISVYIFFTQFTHWGIDIRKVCIDVRHLCFSITISSIIADNVI